MSILIKGVEMPKSCEECFAREHIEAGTDHCAFDYCVFANWHQPRTPLVLTPKELKSKAPYCPLGDVPAHGRLIDADALGADIWKMRARYQMLDDTQTADKIMYGLYLAEQAVKDVPTIIEAEEGET